MINVWEYQDAQDVRVILNTGKIITGKVISVDDAEDESDLGFTEDSISIWDGTNAIGLKQSEIERIEIIK